VKFGTEDLKKGLTPPSHISPHQSNFNSVGHQKLKILLKFTKFQNINTPEGHILRAEFVGRFRMCCLVKFGWICSRGYEIMGVLT